MKRFHSPLASVALLLVASACASTPGPQSDNSRSTELQQLAQSVMTDSGHVSVTVRGNEAFVTGFVESAIDARSIVNALEAAEGIDSVRNGLQREM